MTKKWCLIGMPDDTGVKNVNGRPGAAQGPQCFRQFLSRLRGPQHIWDTYIDLGNVQVRETIEDTHQHTADFIAAHQPHYAFSVLVGGGHDLAFPHLLGLQKSLPKGGRLGCINIDPHYDLRPDEPVFTSGSPFYAALTRQVLQGENFVEFGIQEQCNAPELAAFAAQHHVEVVPYDELRCGRALSVFEVFLQKLAKKTDMIMLSLDLDALQAAFAPGVSAPAAEGYSPSEVIELVRLAAREPKVASLGIYELNPSQDIDNRTARLAATIAWHFASAKLQSLHGQPVLVAE